MKNIDTYNAFMKLNEDIIDNIKVKKYNDINIGDKCVVVDTIEISGGHVSSLNRYINSGGTVMGTSDNGMVYIKHDNGDYWNFNRICLDFKDDTPSLRLSELRKGMRVVVGKEFNEHLETLIDFNRHSHEGMLFNLYGKEGIITDIIKKKTVYDAYSNDPTYTYISSDSPSINLKYDTYVVVNFGDYGKFTLPYMMLYEIAPSYKPKKFERTLEKMNSADEANEIMVKVENSDELIKLKELFIKHKYKVEWIGDLINCKYPLYVFIDFNTNTLSYMEDHAMKEYNYDITSSYIFDRTYNKMYTLNDYNIINLMMNKRYIITPSYKPRKIERTLESRNSAKEANEIIIKIENKKELIKLKELLELYKYGWLNTFERFLQDDRDDINFPTYAFINFIIKDVQYASKETMKEINYDVTNNNILDGVYSRIYTMYNYIDIKSVLNNGIIIPDYKPKKFERTLEKKNSEKDAKEIIVRIENTEELSRLKILAIKYGYWSETFSNITNQEYPVFFFFNFEYNTMSYMLTDSMLKYNYDIPGNKVFNGVYNKIFTIQDYNRIDLMMKNSSIIIRPDYQPKRFERTLEKLKSYDEHKYNSVIIKTNNWDDNKKAQIELIKQGYSWCPPENKSNDIVNYWNDEKYPVYIFVSRNGRLTWSSQIYVDDIIKKDEFSNRRISETIYNSEDVKQIDLIFKSGFVRPIYKPKWFERTLESTNIGYDTLCVRVNTREEMNLLSNMLNDISFDLLGNYDDMEFPNWVYIDMKKIGIRYSAATIWSHKSKEKDAMNYNEKHKNFIHPHIFTIKELNIIKGYILSEGKIPSYKPRKINRDNI